MARVAASGAELAVATSKEWSISSTAAGQFGIITNPTYVRTGAAAIAGIGTTTRFVGLQVSPSSGVIYTKVHFKGGTAFGGEKAIIALRSVTAGDYLVYITKDASHQLRLYDEDGQIGSASWPISSTGWTRIEIKHDSSGGAGATIVEARINGSVFASSSTRSLSASVVYFVIGNNLKSEGVTGDVVFDDLVADNAAYPGSSKIIHVHPDDSGDNNAWLKSDGSAGDTNNYNQTDETVPDDDTTYLKTNSAAIDFYNVGASGLSGTETINAVMVGYRLKSEATTDLPNFRVSIKKQASGTRANGSTVSPSSTSYSTNRVDGGSAGLYDLIRATDPDGAAWSTTTLGSMQIGVEATSSATNYIRLTTLWALVEYEEAGTDTTTSSSSSSSSTTSSSSSTTTTSSTTSSSTTSVPGATTTSSTTTTSSSTTTSTTSSTTSTTSSTTSSSTTTVPGGTTTSSTTTTSSSTSSTSSTTTDGPSTMKPLYEIQPITPILEIRRTYKSPV